MNTIEQQLWDYIDGNLDATEESRVALNQHREKTWMDKRSDYVISFETFCNQQGQKDSLVKYDRYEQIKLRTGSRYKDAKTLREVEWILTHDVDGFPMSYWLLEKGVEVKYVKAAMEVDINLYPKILKQVKDKKLNPKTAIQQKEMSFLYAALLEFEKQHKLLLD